ncbi:MAG: ABC transporter substrate-binding protein, partial [Gammaproteobacteria bacterium]|nr:ABC transporter substrate-binding protein [Gammaproteobacteria bacterium]
MASERIVSLIPSATEIVAALGFADRLVGRSHECDFPASVAALPACSSSRVDPAARSREIDDQVRTIVSEALSVYRVDTPLLEKLAPTHIITQTQCEVCAVSLADVRRAVGELVRCRPEVVSLEPMALPDIWRDIHAVAGSLGAAQRGEGLVAALTARLADLRARTEPLGKRPVVACIEWIDPLMDAGNWVPELVDIAGGTVMTGEAGRHSGYLAMADLLERDPDVIAVMPCGFDIERSRQEM